MGIIAKLVEHFDEQKHKLKVVEECMELCEVLVKSLTKAEEYKPSKEKIVEELGDVIFRIRVLAEKLHVTSDVNKRVLDKADQLDKWFTEKYETKLDTQTNP